jgi:esterase/lipase superfamily enzyme
MSPVTFSAARHAASELTRGWFDVSIPRQHRLANIERPSIWRFEFREDPERHFVIVERTVKAAPVFYAELAARVQRSDRKDAFVFVHGYNVGFDDAVYRTAQIAYDLGFGGAPILFSWPSNGFALEYVADVNNSDWSVGHLKAFLAEVGANSGATSVYLIAHSMGNRVLTGALERLAADTASAPLPRFTHLVLTAPDIDADIFRQLATTIQKTATHVTLYASSNDRALQLSKRINGYPRAGDSGAGIVVVPGIDTIDVSSVDTDFLGHSYYGDNRSVLSDLFNLIRTGASPEGRFGLREAWRGSARYWIFAP